ncbi:MAG TPA: tetratricopeptide repeat protein [Acidiferrobacterales bacterium]|nr:tetratricopeptide repeat protein [Acidiferrobacterales bacterium]
MNRFFSLSGIILTAYLITACAGQAVHEPMAEQPRAITVDRSVNYPPVELTPQIMYDLLLGEIAGQRGYITLSVDMLTQAALKTRDPRLAERATSVALYAKHYAEALKTARLWVELQPENIESREALAEVLLELDHPQEAKQQFARILSLSTNPDNLAQAYLKTAAVLARSQNRATGVEIMQELVQLHAEKPEAYFALAHLAVRQGDLDKAQVSIDRALHLRPGWQEAAVFKARVLVSRKETQKVGTFYESFLKSYPQAAVLRLNYARYLVDLRRWDAARAQFKHIADDNPRDADALYAVGLLALQGNQLDEAEKYLKLNLSVQPENDQSRLYLGQIAEQRKNYAEAARWYEAVESGEYYFEAQMRLGAVFAKQGNVEAARHHLHGIQPESDQQRVQLVLSEDQILRDGKQYQESLKVLSSALTALPDDPDLLYARALVAEKLDMLDAHERDLRKLIQMDAKNVQALNALGYTLADRTNRFKEAFELIERALALKPDDPFIMDSMGWVHYRMGNTAEAVKFLKRALAIRSDAEISAHLGEVLWVTGDRAAAETIWKQALRDTPDNEVLLGIIKKFKP